MAAVVPPDLSTGRRDKQNGRGARGDVAAREGFVKKRDLGGRTSH